MSTRAHAFSSITLAVGTVLVLAACGSGGGTESPSPSTSGAPPAMETETAPAEAPSTGTAGTDPAASPSASGPATPTAGAPGSSAPAGDAAACTADRLSGTIEDQAGGGAAGSVYRTLVLTNTSDAACTTAGLPGVSYVDAGGNQVGAAAARSDAAAVAVVLEPGQSATAELQETRAQNYGDRCTQVPVTGLLVYPPDDTTSLVIPHEGIGCSESDVELLTVGALQPR